MKKFIFSSALLMALAAVSFAGNPKEVKEASASETKTGTPLYWYRVTYDVDHEDGYIPASTSVYAQAEKSMVTSPCDPGDNEDCLRGFTQPLGGAESDAPGTDQIKKD